MGIHQMPVPDGTYYGQRDLSGTVLYLEPLTKIMIFEYYSDSKNKEISIEIDLSKQELMTNGKKMEATAFPYELPTVIKSAHTGVVALSLRYQQKWSSTAYHKIVQFLKHAVTILPPEPVEEVTNSYFFFNPDYVFSLEGHLNDENDDYHAECKPITLWSLDTNRNIPTPLPVEKIMHLYLEGETITVEHYYYRKGEQDACYSNTIPNLPNDGKDLKRILEDYEQKIEEGLLEVLVLKE